jgi:hypothetical protein
MFDRTDDRTVWEALFSALGRGPHLPRPLTPHHLSECGAVCALALQGLHARGLALSVARIEVRSVDSEPGPLDGDALAFQGALLVELVPAPEPIGELAQQIATAA